MPVVIDLETKKKVDAASLTAFAKQAHRAVGLRGDLGILITGDAEMRALNRQFRRKNKPTDVISFPAFIKGVAGDIAISADIADKNAGRFGHSLTEELQVLLLHGMLHLGGYDHERDSGEMAELESRLRKRFGLQDSLIGRTQVADSKGVARQKARQVSTTSRIKGLRPQRQKSRPKRRANNR